METGPSPPGWCLPGQWRLWVPYHARVHISPCSGSLLNPRYLCVHQPINNCIMLLNYLAGRWSLCRVRNTWKMTQEWRRVTHFGRIFLLLSKKRLVYMARKFCIWSKTFAATSDYCFSLWWCHSPPDVGSEAIGMTDVCNLWLDSSAVYTCTYIWSLKNWSIKNTCNTSK